jgi:hypothetical protein
MCKNLPGSADGHMARCGFRGIGLEWGMKGPRNRKG